MEMSLALRGNLCKIVMCLLRNPAFRTSAKDLKEPYVHFRREAAPTVDLFGEHCTSDAQCRRRGLQKITIRWRTIKA